MKKIKYLIVIALFSFIAGSSYIVFHIFLSDKQMINKIIKDGAYFIEIEDIDSIAGLLSDSFEKSNEILNTAEHLFLIQDETEIKIIRRDMMIEEGTASLDLTVLITAELQNIGRQMGRASAKITFSKDKVKGYRGWRINSLVYTDELDFMRENLD